MPFSPYLHGLRGMAALGVLLFHWSTLFPAASQALASIRWGPEPWMNLSLALANGWQGVPLFFVLSAFLLASNWAGRPVTRATVLPYLRRRFLRIYPAVWAQLAVLAVLPLPGLLASWDLPTLVLNALLWINLPPWMAAPLNGVWWTLPVELGFYALLPALVALRSRSNATLVYLACLAVAIGWRWACLQWFAGEDLAQRLHIIDALPGSLATFAAGWWLAGRAPVASIARRWMLLLVVAAAYAALQYALWTHDAVYLRGHWILAVWVPLLGLVVAAGVYLLQQPLPGLGVLGSRPARWFGEMSFGIYLWHYPVQKAFVLIWPDRWSSPSASVGALLATSGVTFLLAWVSYHAVEKRFFRPSYAPGIDGTRA
jgi:peptidoglycan/LPS O-acetylase OafA/YrhL